MICSVCSKEIEDFEKDLRGDIYCIECYRKKYLDSECVECGKIGRGYKTDYHGNEYCDECFDISTHTCDNCGDVYPLDEIQKKEGEYYCRDCFDEIFIECSDCGEIINREDTYSTANGDIICDKCFDRHYFTCYHCDEVYHIDNGINVINSRNREVVVCRDCSNDYYVECYSCGAIIHIDISYYREYDGYSYCEDCYPGDCPEIDCHDYGYKPSPIFHNIGEKVPRTYFGVEMEVENLGDAYYTNDAIYDIKKHSNNEELFYIKADGSLNNGFEIVTHPCTLAYHKTRFPWDQIKDTLDSWSCSAESTCGLHIHVSKRIYSELDLIKLALFIFNVGNQHYINLIARRKFNSFSSRKNLEDCKKKDLKYSQSRYEAVNFTNDKTVEFRMFKGTIKPEIVIASIEFVDSVTNFVKSSSIAVVSKEDSWANYISYVIDNGKKYKVLIDYMKERFEKTINTIQ
jgi:hypothetical protein